jgi:hypothetical protein
MKGTHCVYWCNRERIYCSSSGDHHNDVDDLPAYISRLGDVMLTRTYERALWHGQNLSKCGDKKASSTNRGRRKTRLSDAECKEIRARSEFYSSLWPDWKLADHYGVPTSHIEYLLSYQSRIHLIHTIEDANISTN